MKAVIYIQYGSSDVLQMTDVEKPTPKDNEVLIRVRTTSVCFGGLTVRNMRSVSPRKFTMPYSLGTCTCKCCLLMGIHF